VAEHLETGMYRDHQLMTASAFMQSYDRDILDLQDNPDEYISELEADLETACPMGFSFDQHGNKVWPVGLMRQVTGVIMEEPLWECPSAAT
jgi:hypothetical protein